MGRGVRGVETFAMKRKKRGIFFFPFLKNKEAKENGEQA